MERTKIRYVLNEKSKEYAEALTVLIYRIKDLNKNIKTQEREVLDRRERANKEKVYLKSLVRKRTNFVRVLKDLKVVKRKKIKGKLNGSNPSEAVSLNNPEIQIYLSEEDLAQEEKREQVLEKLRKVRK